MIEKAEEEIARYFKTLDFILLEIISYSIHFIKCSTVQIVYAYKNVLLLWYALLPLLIMHKESDFYFTYCILFYRHIPGTSAVLTLKHTLLLSIFIASVVYIFVISIRESPICYVAKLSILTVIKC